MTDAIFQVHPFLAYIAYAFLIAAMWLLGYWESRAYPAKPGAACATWLWALLITSGGLFGSTALGAFGQVLGVLLLAVGVICIARYWEKHKRDYRENSHG
jgi:hypothetical protein